MRLDRSPDDGARTLSATFPGEAASVGRARRFVAELLAGQPLPARDLAAILVSELATNAVVHGTTDFTVAVDRRRSRTRVSVTDRGPGLPVLRRPGVTDVHGRGLQIVQHLADSWGVDEHAGDVGKSVWFDLRTALDADRAVRPRLRPRPSASRRHHARMPGRDGGP